MSQKTKNPYELYKKIAPYIVPVLLAIVLILLLIFPIKPPKKDVLKFKTIEPVGNLCDRILALNFTDKRAKLGDMDIRWIGLSTNESYPMFLAIDRTIWGYYEVRLIRCDLEGAFFPIECKILTTEGDEERTIIHEDKISKLFIYTGNVPEGITAYCVPVSPIKE